jgi:hypothetical protein
VPGRRGPDRTGRDRTIEPKILHAYGAQHWLRRSGRQIGREFTGRGRRGRRRGRGRIHARVRLVPLSRRLDATPNRGSPRNPALSRLSLARPNLPSFACPPSAPARSGSPAPPAHPPPLATHPRPSPGLRRVPLIRATSTCLTGPWGPCTRPARLATTRVAARDQRPGGDQRDQPSYVAPSHPAQQRRDRAQPPLVHGGQSPPDSPFAPLSPRFRPALAPAGPPPRC